MLIGLVPSVALGFKTRSTHTNGCHDFVVGSSFSGTWYQVLRHVSVLLVGGRGEGGRGRERGGEEREGGRGREGRGCFRHVRHVSVLLVGGRGESEEQKTRRGRGREREEGKKGTEGEGGQMCFESTYCSLYKCIPD